MAHSRTRNLADNVRQADIVIAATGRAGMVKGDWIKPGATVIDVGTTRAIVDGKKRLLGDVDRGAFEDVADEVLATTMSILRRAAPEAAAVALQPTAPDDRARDGGRTARKRAAVTAQPEGIADGMLELGLAPQSFHREIVGPIRAIEINREVAISLLQSMHRLRLSQPADVFLLNDQAGGQHSAGAP